MPEADKSPGGGGFHAGGDINATAGGDIVGRDKITTTTTNTGFKEQANKDEFLAQVEELRAALRDIRSQVAGIEQLDEDAKEELEAEILQQVKALKDSRQEAEQIEVGQPPASDKIESVKATFEGAEAFLDRIKKIGETVTGFASEVVPIVAKALPLLASTKQLIGL